MLQFSIGTLNTDEQSMHSFSTNYLWHNEPKSFDVRDASDTYFFSSHKYRYIQVLLC